jgi:hypothetical protein
VPFATNQGAGDRKRNRLHVGKRHRVEFESGMKAAARRHIPDDCSGAYPVYDATVEMNLDSSVGC